MLADPVRSRILFALSAATELCVGDLALALDVTEDSGVVRAEDAAAGGPGGLPQGRPDGLLPAQRRVPHRMLEQCLRELLAIAVPGGER